MRDLLRDVRAAAAGSGFSAFADLTLATGLGMTSRYQTSSPSEVVGLVRMIIADGPRPVR